MLGSSFALILEDPKILSDLCGAQDENIKALEKILEVPIYIRGNQITLDSQDEETRRHFKVLMELLADQAEGGCSLTPDTIRVFHDSLKDPESGAAERIKSAYIQIPSGPRIKPRTYPQAAYIQGMKSRDLVFSIGPGGTGKTFLAVAHALQEILEKRKKKLVLTRPVVEAGENLGFLPGDLSQKLNPYLRPLYDAMDRLIPAEMIQRMEENRVIELAPLAYMRGRSLENAYIILDEAQNTTREQMKMFLTRMGEGSRMVVTGDITQIDLPDKSHSGLVQVRDLLKPLDEIGFYYFTSKDVIRHPLVRKIIEIYEKNK